MQFGNAYHRLCLRYRVHGRQIRAWITVLLLLTVMANSYRSMRRKERERQDKPRK